MEAETTTEKPKRTVSRDLKSKMKAGRERAAKVRRTNKAAAVLTDAVERRLIEDKSSGPPEFLGITKNDCPVDCTAESCVITGVGFCGHPCKGALQPVYMSNRDTVERYNRARKHLAHVELDKRP